MRVSLWNLVEDVWMKVDIFHSHMQCKYKVTRTVLTVWGAGIWSCEVTPMVKVYFVTNRHICQLLVGWQLNISWTTVHEHFTISWSLCTSHLKPHPWHARGKAGTITSYSPACVSLGGGVNTHFDFFVVWFSRLLEVVQGKKWADDFKPSENQSNFFADERGIHI